GFMSAAMSWRSRVSGFQRPEKSGLSSLVRGVGAERLGLPSAVRGVSSLGTLWHRAESGGGRAGGAGRGRIWFNYISFDWEQRDGRGTVPALRSARGLAEPCSL